MRLKKFFTDFKTSIFNFEASVVARSWTDVLDGLSEGAAVVHDRQRVGERVEGGKEESEAHPSGENTKLCTFDKKKQFLSVLDGK